MDLNFNKDVNNHIRCGPLRVAFLNDQPIAFIAFQSFPELKAVYLAGMVKKRSAPSGLVETIVKDFIQTIHPSVVATRTQNDRVMEIMIHLCDITIPFDRLANQTDLNLLSKLNLLTPNTDLNTLIVRGCYGNQMILDLPRRRVCEEKITTFSDLLDYQSGDAALLIGYRKYEKK